MLKPTVLDMLPCTDCTDAALLISYPVPRIQFCYQCHMMCLAATHRLISNAKVSVLYRI